ncbi:33 kDa chaperonin [Terrihabitans soli]|uniref:33 kDa chaperonin n=1 Tax=Terrihabitans soli TaxID=708113 RepID=A0A6S6QWL3_9HYPH|nr:Hsp33 family molecular chaperone [Terrihabitans soli]BCJ91955.1 33 kDa chaperonin [Terrihabitans soli]
MLANSDDRILPFQVEGLDVRGRVVRLGPSIDTVLARHDYPAPVSKVLGEAVALTVLLGSSLKLDGRFQLQTRSDGPIDMLVVDFEAPDRVRAYARFDKERLEAANGAPTGELLGKGHLAMTIDPGAEMSRYQGVVPLDGAGLEDAAHEYFKQSEQIPTRVRLAVAEAFGSGEHAWRAGGILVQFLPEAGESVRDLPGGDVPEGITPPADDEDAWTEAKSLVETVEDHELIDPTIASEELLYRLFHERGVRVFQQQEVRHSCRCSDERILGMLKSFTDEEKRSMIDDDGQINVTCEFCSTKYTVSPSEIGIETN